MPQPQLPADHRGRIAREARQQFVTRIQRCLAPMLQAIGSRLSELSQEASAAREMHERRDAMMDFDRMGADWARAAARAWRQAAAPALAVKPVKLESRGLELIDDEVVERKILSSRLAQAIQEKAAWELNDLRVRMQYLEDENELGEADVLRPEALAAQLVERWFEAGLSRAVWALVHDVIQRSIVEHVPPAYAGTNEFLVANGIMRDIDLSARVKRGASAGGTRRSEPAALDSRLDPAEASGSAAVGIAKAGDAAPGAFRGHGANQGYAAGAGSGPAGTAGRNTAAGLSQQGGAGDQGAAPGAGWGGAGGQQADPAGRQPRDGAGDRRGAVADETRMMTSAPPLARARMRASGVLGQLKRLLMERVAGYDGAPATRPSPALTAALSRHAVEIQTTELQSATGRPLAAPDDAAVQAVATDLRRRSAELKKQAATSTEKATIEIVALMFQSILSEERIPPAIRVWFARLQMPVLRVAIAEPEFFGSLDHPARQLIDRMGSCVMGFDPAAISGTALETEIKRVVQVIEQYPDTGRRVFQLVFDEFQKFLSKFLTDNAPTQRLVSIAQQVEQKETLAVQYTIELRSMLADVPVREEIREFLFKVWTDVLAVAAVRHGPQDDDTLALKKCATDLVWAASAKPNRAERARVIQDLPPLLQRLRQGMALVGLANADQEAHIKAIGDILADAFLSKTQAIPASRIQAIAKRLAHLEDYVAKDPASDLPLNAESIEMMLGIDASMIEIVAGGGSRPGAAMLAWAGELQLGNWFALDHNGAITQVQYSWRSQRNQLHLFAAPAGRSYLFQVGRLAAYLQAGLLLPAEEEAITVRATREALAKLDANPERLLQ